MNEKLIVERQDNGEHTFLTLHGTIDEDANLKEVFAKLESRVLINLEDIQMINSVGVREWIHAIHRIPEAHKIQYDKCSPRIVEQINHIANFLGRGKVHSFYAPYFCVKCKKEENVLLEVKELLKSCPIHPPARKCAHCSFPMEFDDIEEEYFSFLQS